MAYRLHRDARATGDPCVSCRAALDRFIRVASSRTAGTFGRS